MARAARHIVSFVLAAAVLPVVLSGHAEAQTGESVIAWHVTIAPSWFDPSTAPAQITPFGILYALHDSVVRATYGSKIGPGLAEAWSESPDGLTYEFRLRRGLKFHNGDAVTAEDVKFSFERYKGAAAKELQSRVEAIEVVNPLTVKFRLKAPWPDFMTFYGTTVSGAGLVVPKKYVTQVGDEGFRKHPIGAGPYRFVSHKPGVEVVVEAYTGYWRRVPSVKRFVMKSVPEGTTRVAMLKNGEADIAYALDGEDALNVRRDSRLALIPSKHASIYWIEFADQWDPKSVWHDKRVRQAAILAIDRPAGNAASRVGEFIYSKGTYAYGGYPDIDELFLQQSKERDVAKREAILHKIQQLTIDRAMFLPIMDYRTLRGVGPRVADHALDGMPLNPFPIYEDIKLKN